MTLWNALSSKKYTLVLGKILSSQIVSRIVLKFKQVGGQESKVLFFRLLEWQSWKNSFVV